ncbi:MAG: sugar phosphorylase [Thiohalocapsa sp.]|nr:sugar phosphorylase [Thiohalocapsa sp.]MCF7990664.1 sugar phosphorylase [Thiohalocapsa sp.]
MRVVERSVFERIRERLRTLYGDALLDRLMQRLDLIVGRYGVGVSCPEDKPCRRWDQRDAVLITYGDMVSANGEPPLTTLRRFLAEQVGDAFSAVHVLPFFPYSSDDGFSVIDYRAVDPALGGWDEIQALANDYRLMVDLVINHVSGQSRWFRAYCNGMAPERHYFVEVDPEADLSAVVRPRTSPLLRAVHTPAGLRHVWATFSHDQIDVDFSNPDVLFEYLDILLYYVHNGAQIIRLDAIAYLWKQIGTDCIHLPQTHEVVKLLRDVLDMLDPSILLLTETNVPHAENVAYFGAGDEAHMVYQFSLPPLLLHALHTGNARYLTDWAARLEPPPLGCTFFNFTASHDGIGVRPLEGLLPQEEFDALVSAVEAGGGLVSRRSNADGSTTPYELNTTYFDALRVPDDPLASIARFLCSQTIAMSLQGVPGIYFNSLLGASNDVFGVEESGRARSINRQKWVEPELLMLLAGDSGHQAGGVFPEYLRRLRLRGAQPAFHPDGPQHVLSLPAGLFGVCRDAPDASQPQSIQHEGIQHEGIQHEGIQPQRLWMLANLTARTVTVAFGRIDRRWKQSRWTELIEGRHYAGDGGADKLVLAPYQVLWLVRQTAPPGAASGDNALESAAGGDVADSADEPPTA